MGNSELPNTEEGIIKSLLINPVLYSNIKTTIKLLRTFEYSLSEASQNPKRIIKTFLIVLSSEYGREVLEHLLEYGGYTYREIELKLGVSKTTVHYITGKLMLMGFVESKTVVMPINHKSPGPRPMVWVIVGGDPKLSRDCIQRYYELPKPETVVYEPAIIYKFSEKGQNIANIMIKYFMDRDFLEPSAGKIKTDILRDEPDMPMQEREAIVKHIIMKVRELREADS